MSQYFFANYTCTLREPALCRGPLGDPNTAVSLPYLPGSVLRGALAARATGVDFDELIMSGRVMYLNAYPAIRVNDTTVMRGLPTPLCWRHIKHERLDNDTMKHRDVAAVPPARNDELETPYWPFALWYHTRHYARSVTLTDATHINTGAARARDENTRRESIFHYQALPAGECFKGGVMLRADDEAGASALLARLQPLCNTLQLGRARDVQYGGAADIRWDPITQFPSRELSSNELIARDIHPGELFRFILTSDYRGRHAITGQDDPLAIINELQSQLPVMVDMNSSVWAFMPGGQYIRRWHLPTPQTLALAAGSVLVLTTTEQVAYSTLLQLERAGFGEGRIDGFGRGVFARHAADCEVNLHVEPQAAPPAQPAPFDSESAVGTMQRRMLETALEQAIMRMALDVVAKGEGKEPSRHAVGRLRMALRMGPNNLRNLITHMTNKDAACLRYRLEKIPLQAWLEERIADSFDVLRALEIDELPSVFLQTMDKTGERLARAREVLGDRVVDLRTRYVDYVLALLARKVGQ